MSKYALIKGGQIEGWTSHPNATSSVPVDENSQDWKDFKKATKDKGDHKKRHSGVSLPDVLDEMESLFPGFIAAAQARH